MFVIHLLISLRRTPSDMSQLGLAKLAHALYMAANDPSKANQSQQQQQQHQHQHQVYFRPIDEAGGAPPPMHQESAPVMMFPETRILSTPSPLLPPPSPLYSDPQERAVLDELSFFLRRSVSPSLFALPMLPPAANTNTNTSAAFMLPSLGVQSPRAPSPINSSPSSAFQRPAN